MHAAPAVLTRAGGAHTRRRGWMAAQHGSQRQGRATTRSEPGAVAAAEHSPGWGDDGLGRSARWPTMPKKTEGRSTSARATPARKITSTAHTRTHTTSTTHGGTNAVRMRKCGKCGVGAPGRPRTTGTSTERARARPRSRRPLTAGTGLRAQWFGARADGARQSGRRRPSPQSRPGLAIHRKRVGSHARQSPVDERKSAVVAFVW